MNVHNLKTKIITKEKEIDGFGQTSSSKNSNCVIFIL